MGHLAHATRAGKHARSAQCYLPGKPLCAILLALVTPSLADRQVQLHPGNTLCTRPDYISQSVQMPGQPGYSQERIDWLSRRNVFTPVAIFRNVRLFHIPQFRGLVSTGNGRGYEDWLPFQHCSNCGIVGAIGACAYYVGGLRSAGMKFNVPGGLARHRLNGGNWQSPMMRARGEASGSEAEAYLDTDDYIPM